MAIELLPYDTADFLRNEKEVLDYLNLCAEENGDDAQFIVHAIGVAARARLNMKKLSQSTGITREGLYKALSENGNPSFSTVLRVLAAAGFGIAFVRRARAIAKKARATAKAPAKAAVKKRAAPKKKAAR